MFLEISSYTSVVSKFLVIQKINAKFFSRLYHTSLNEELLERGKTKKKSRADAYWYERITLLEILLIKGLGPNKITVKYDFFAWKIFPRISRGRRNRENKFARKFDPANWSRHRSLH